MLQVELNSRTNLADGGGETGTTRGGVPAARRACVDTGRRGTGCSALPSVDGGAPSRDGPLKLNRGRDEGPKRMREQEKECT